MDKKIIVTIILNAWQLRNAESVRLTSDWIEYRMDIFRRYTARSLLAQTNRNFDVVVVYANESEDFIQKVNSKYPALPSRFHFVPQKLYNKILINLIKGHEYFYQVRIDSDDMFRKDYIQCLIDYIPSANTEALILRNGYLYDIENDLLATYTKESPPFYTLIYKSNDFISGKRYKFTGHRDVLSLKHEFVGFRQFCVLVHGKNTSTSFNLEKYHSQIINDPALKNKILDGFIPNKNNVAFFKKFISRIKIAKR